MCFVNFSVYACKYVFLLDFITSCIERWDKLPVCCREIIKRGFLFCILIQIRSCIIHFIFPLNDLCTNYNWYLLFCLGPGGSRSSSTSSLSSIASEVRAASVAVSATNLSPSTPSSPLRHLTLADSESLFKGPLRDQQSNNQNNNNQLHNNNNNNNMHSNNRLVQQQSRKNLLCGKHF